MSEGTPNSRGLGWPSLVLLGAICLAAVSAFLFGNDLATRMRYQIVGRDSVTGDVILFDGQVGTVRRLRVPEAAEDTLALLPRR